jgi:hypothetical protein
MMYHKILVLIFTVFISIFAVFSQTSVKGVKNRIPEKRLALVIGNARYRNTTALNNTVNDANDIAETLRQIGFEVILGTDLSKREMENLIRQFGDKLSQQNGISLFYYSGHGVQSNNKNYLIPIDADIPSEDEIAYQTIDLNFILGKLNSADNSSNIVILDACRSNPFAKQWSKTRAMEAENGLAGITKAPTGTLIAYATQPDATASDGTGRNGLYTAELLKQLKRTNLNITQVFQNTRAEVVKKSANKQVPWELSSLLTDLNLNGNNYNSNNQNESESQNETNKSNLSIDFPSNSSTVGILADVRGRTPFLGLNHYLVVYSLQAKRLFIQQPVKINSNGTWEGTAAFGTESYGIGDQWSIRIFATNSVFDVGEIRQLPSDARISNEIIVTRNR